MSSDEKDKFDFVIIFSVIALFSIALLFFSQ
jgi:hypothetical protein